MIRKFLNPSGKLTYEEALRQAGERVEKERKDYLTTSNDNTWVERRNGKQKNKHLKKRGIKGAKSHALWKQEHPILNAAGTVASAAPLAVAAYPLVAGTGELAYGIGNAAAATTAGKTLLPWIDAGLTSYFGAHGLNHAINEGVNGWGDAAMTALEVAPLGRLAKPLYEGVVQPGMKLFNSPLTGKWTTIGNKQYRLSPNSLGANGSSIEQRMPQITAENAASITPEQWRAAYRAAYKKGDRAEGQRLWKLWFRQQAKNNKLADESNLPIKLRHNTDSEPWNVYDESYFDSGTGDGGWYGKGLYATGNSWEEGAYGKNSMYLYGYMEEPAVVPPANIELNKLPDNFTTSYIAKDLFNRGVSKEDYIRNLDGEVLEWYKKYPELISKAIDNVKKADGVIVQREALQHTPFAPFDEVVLPKGTHIKSAEPFTLDDNGKLIELTDRANFNINDNRYGLIPFGIGLTGYGLYNSFNQPLQQSLYYKQGGKMIYKFKKGNKIHIKKANRGKFTDYCGGKVTNECILRGKNSSDPAVRKRATFAANARKWNHKKGGIIVAGNGIKLGNIFSKAQGFLNSDTGKLVKDLAGKLYSGIKESNNLRKQEEQLLKDYNYISKQINTLDVINKTNQLFQELQLQDPNIHVSEIDWRNLYGKNEGIAKQLAQANARNYLVNARQLMMLLNSQSSGGGLDFSGLINAGALLLAGNKNKTTNTGTTNTGTTNTQIPSTATPTYFSSSFDWSKPTFTSAIKFNT